MNALKARALTNYALDPIASDIAQKIEIEAKKGKDFVILMVDAGDWLYRDKLEQAGFEVEIVSLNYLKVSW